VRVKYLQSADQKDSETKDIDPMRDSNESTVAVAEVALALFHSVFNSFNR
jgi:hypothetical protein